MDVKEMKKSIVGYVRESTKDQAENGFNLADQKRKIQAYVNLYNESYTDNICWMIEAGASAKTLKRPQMQLLLDEVKNEKVNCVIVHNLDRLTRRVKDLAILLELFNKHDVQLVSITEKIDTSSAQGRFFIFLIVLIAQWEQDTISERTKRGIYSSAQEGNYAKARVPFGYKRVGKKPEKDANLENCMIDLFNKLIDYNYSISSIVYYMKEKYGHLNKWTYNSVVKIAKNPIYYGTYLDSIQKIDNHSPTYITYEEFVLIQNHLKLRLHYFDEAAYLYKNIVFCAKCNKLLMHKSARSRSTIYRYYYCQGCNARINENELDKVVRQRIVEKYIFQKKDKLLNRIIDKSRRIVNKQKSLQLVYRKGMITQGNYESENNDLISKMIELQKQYNNREKEILKEFRDMDDAKFRNIILELVESITVEFAYNNKTKVEINFKKKV